MCRLRPDPGFSDDNNYLKNTFAEEEHLDYFGELPQEKVILADGTDVTEEVLKAERWLIEHSFRYFVSARPLPKKGASASGRPS